MASRSIIVMTLLALAGCATQADIQDMHREQRSIRKQLADTRATVDEMQRDMGAIQGRVEETRYSSRQSSAQRLENIEARLAALEQGQVRAPAAAPGNVGGAPALQEGATESVTPPAVEAAPAPPRPEIAANDLAREEAREMPDDYRKGLAQVRQGEYDKALQSFRDFLRTNGDSPLAANAQYWIGECYYQRGQYSQAIVALNDLWRQHPKSDRVPPALLKIGLTFMQMNNKSDARLFFQKVVNDFPSSPEAAQAREKLRTLGA